MNLFFLSVNFILKILMKDLIAHKFYFQTLGEKVARVFLGLKLSMLDCVCNCACVCTVVHSCMNTYVPVGVYLLIFCDVYDRCAITALVMLLFYK